MGGQKRFKYSLLYIEFVIRELQLYLELGVEVDDMLIARAVLPSFSRLASPCSMARPISRSVKSISATMLRRPVLVQAYR